VNGKWRIQLIRQEAYEAYVTCRINSGTIKISGTFAGRCLSASGFVEFNQSMSLKPYLGMRRLATKYWDLVACSCAGSHVLSVIRIKFSAKLKERRGSLARPCRQDKNRYYVRVVRPTTWTREKFVRFFFYHRVPFTGLFQSLSSAISLLPLKQVFSRTFLERFLSRKTKVDPLISGLQVE